MATSYADSSQAREWDRRYDAWGREKKSQVQEFHDYEADAAKRAMLLDEKRVRDLAERKASAKRIAAAVEQIGDFFGYNEVRP
ncbi:hypothetical protein [Pseudomonas sp. TH10]|uniref:hypothetical protein n=1 Tax=Pseudomonas sp. TH10 TaxID=2796376 RepID=UPI001913E5A2|nr:hypothetical protein [Pseudomonas sp. TH10]MBK5516428.1 hypothetical protein [Pseudomonas sp. TH10]